MNNSKQKGEYIRITYHHTVSMNSQILYQGENQVRAIQAVELALNRRDVVEVVHKIEKRRTTITL